MSYISGRGEHAPNLVISDDASGARGELPKTVNKEGKAGGKERDGDPWPQGLD